MTIVPSRTDADIHEWLTPSVLLLAAANLVPLYGVLFRGWQVFPTILLFWFENAVIGAFNVLKMLFAAPGEPDGRMAKLLLIPFFWVHYGGFVSSHGLFVFLLFGPFLRERERFTDAAAVWQALVDLHIGWAVPALVASHGLSFVMNYVRGGEYRRADVRTLMLQPYHRVAMLHAVLIVGGIFVMWLGSPVPAMTVLVLLKILFDASAHVQERRRFTRGGSGA